jgi:hypothetical protein
LLKELNDLYDPQIYPNGSWLTILTEIRNTGMHRNIINIRVEVNLHEDLTTGKSRSSPTRTYFKADPDSTLEIIPYLEDRIQKMKELITKILDKDPLLSRP